MIRTATRPTSLATALAAALAGLLLAGVVAGADAAEQAPPAVAGDGYVADIADLPLMPGLAEVPEAGVAFDKPGGRIVSAYAHGAVDARGVRRFYRETLPQLGWRPKAPDVYIREDEVLHLDLLGEDGDLTVRYTLQPR